MIKFQKGGEQITAAQFKARHPSVTYAGDRPSSSLARSFGFTPVWVAQLVTPEQVNAERDRRLPLDFEFNGKMYQRDAVSIARISGAGALALGAIVQGAQPGDLNWHGRATPFAWIASDDTLTTMDAQTCFAFGAAAAAVETEIIFAAKALRTMDPIPSDFTDDGYWP